MRTAGSLFVRARPSLGGENVQKGEFRGTLISHDQDSLVRGTARLENAAKTMQRPMTITVDPDRPKEIILSGGGLAGTFTR